VKLVRHLHSSPQRKARPARELLVGELDVWKRWIAAWRSRVEVFAYFDNDWEGFAVKNALWLRDRLG
jgi:uncharacterized protein YecE (DUF72 family)